MRPGICTSRKTHVGAEAADFLHGLPPRGGLARERHVGEGREQVGEALPGEGLVVGDEHAEGRGRGHGASGAGVEGQFHGGDTAARRAGGEAEPSGVAVARGEAGARVGEAHALVRAGAHEAGPIVLDLHDERRAHPLRRHRHVPRAVFEARHPVLDGVLDKRLEQQRGHERAGHAGRNVERRREPVAEADALDVEVVVEESDLVGEGDLALPRVVEHAAQEGAQAGHHAAHARRVALGEGGNGVERVEEKVRVELHPQRVEARGGQQRRQAHRLGLALAAPGEVGPRVPGGEQRQVEEQVAEKAGGRRQRLRTQRGQSHRRGRRAALRRKQAGAPVAARRGLPDRRRTGRQGDALRGLVDGRGQQQADAEVERGAAEPPVGLQRQVLGERQHNRRGPRPQRPGEQHAPEERIHRHVGPRRVERAEDGEEREHGAPQREAEKHVAPAEPAARRRGVGKAVVVHGRGRTGQIRRPPPLRRSVRSRPGAVHDGRVRLVTPGAWNGRAPVF